MPAFACGFQSVFGLANFGECVVEMVGTKLCACHAVWANQSLKP